MLRAKEHFIFFRYFTLGPTFGFLKEFGGHHIKTQKAFPQVYKIGINFNPKIMHSWFDLELFWDL